MEGIFSGGYINSAAFWCFGDESDCLSLAFISIYVLPGIGLGVSLLLERGLRIFWVIGVPRRSCAPKLADLGATKKNPILSLSNLLIVLRTKSISEALGLSSYNLQ